MYFISLLYYLQVQLFLYLYYSKYTTSAYSIQLSALIFNKDICSMCCIKNDRSDHFAQFSLINHTFGGFAHVCCTNGAGWGTYQSVILWVQIVRLGLVYTTDQDLIFKIWFFSALPHPRSCWPSLCHAGMNDHDLMVAHELRRKSVTHNVSVFRSPATSSPDCESWFALWHTALLRVMIRPQTTAEVNVGADVSIFSRAENWNLRRPNRSSCDSVDASHHQIHFLLRVKNRPLTKKSGWHLSDTPSNVIQWLFSIILPLNNAAS